MNFLSAALLCDFYKISHRAMYPVGTEVVYSTWTPRASRTTSKTVVAAGHQMAIQKLVEFFDANFFSQTKQQVVCHYSNFISKTLGEKAPHTQHLKDLHDLGYLPLLIKALPEGTVVPLRTPVLTVQNTDHRFFWLTNYIETYLSCSLWQTSTSATIAFEYRKLLNNYSDLTVGNRDFVDFQGHDFSMRGMSGLESSMMSGIGHLMSFCGTDTIPAIQAAEYFYDADDDKEMVGTSIPATEHSIQCAYSNDMNYFDNIISRVHPEGMVSIVSDGYDFWNVIGRVLPEMKPKIMSRKGKVVIRPDSGDPVKIVCGDPAGKTELERKGAVEALWDIFGGTKTQKGYKLLDGHIGLIYGDAITLERAGQILLLLEAKGFASTNVVFGIGSYTYQYNTRDTFGFAMKSTMCQINGKEKEIFKDPKTDDGIKRSQRGCVAVLRNNGIIRHVEGLGLSDVYPADLLEVVFKDGTIMNLYTLAEIRTRIRNHLE